MRVISLLFYFSSFCVSVFLHHSRSVTPSPLFSLVSLCLSLFVYLLLTLFLYVYLSQFLSLNFILSQFYSRDVCHYVSLFCCLSLLLTVSLSLSCFSVCKCLYVSLYVCVSFSLCLYVWVHLFMSIFAFVHVFFVFLHTMYSFTHIQACLLAIREKNQSILEHCTYTERSAVKRHFVCSNLKTKMV